MLKTLPDNGLHPNILTPPLWSKEKMSGYNLIKVLRMSGYSLKMT